MSTRWNYVILYDGIFTSPDLTVEGQIHPDGAYLNLKSKSESCTVGQRPHPSNWRNCLTGLPSDPAALMEMLTHISTSDTTSSRILQARLVKEWLKNSRANAEDELATHPSSV